MPDHSHYAPEEFLRDNLHHFLSAKLPGPVLDLACGSGHNGLFLAGYGLEVHFWDKDRANLEKIASLGRSQNLRVYTKEVDFESARESPLPRQTFGAILVFRYLHRPLIPGIKEALCPGGIIMYQTFTIHQARVGKPRNPDFLLRDNELKAWFSSWEILHHSQGPRYNPLQYLAQLIAQKPGN